MELEFRLTCYIHTMEFDHKINNGFNHGTMEFHHKINNGFHHGMNGLRITATPIVGCEFHPIVTKDVE